MLKYVDHLIQNLSIPGYKYYDAPDDLSVLFATISDFGQASDVFTVSANGKVILFCAPLNTTVEYVRLRLWYV